MFKVISGVSKKVSRVYRESPTRVEAVINDLNLTVFDFQSKLYIQLLQLNDKQLEYTQTSAKHQKTIGKIHGKLQTKLNIIAEQQKELLLQIEKTVTEMKQALIRISKRSSSKLDIFTYALLDLEVFVNKLDRPTVAFDVIRNLLNRSAIAQRELLEKRMQREFVAPRLTLPGTKGVSAFGVGQNYYVKEGMEFVHPVYERATFQLKWQIHEAMDEGIDYETIESQVMMPWFVARLEKINQEIGKGQEMSPALYRSMLKRLDRYQPFLPDGIREKKYASILLRTAADVMRIHHYQKIPFQLGLAKLFLDFRQKEAQFIRTNMIDRKLAAARKTGHERNIALIETMNAILAILKNPVELGPAMRENQRVIPNRRLITRFSNRQKLTLIEAAREIGYSYWMREPELTFVREAAFGLAGSLENMQKARDPEEHIAYLEKAKAYAQFIVRRARDSERQHEFMAVYRNLYLQGIKDFIEKNQMVNQPSKPNKKRMLRVVKQEAYKQALQSFFKKNPWLTATEREHNIYQALSYIPVFIKTVAGHGETTWAKPITNPLFEAAMDLFSIIYTDDFWLLINNNHLSEDIADKLASYDNKSMFCQLDRKEKQQVIESIANNKELGDKDILVLQKMAGLKKI